MKPEVNADVNWSVLNRDGWDREIMRRVRSVANDIPAELEQVCMDDLETVIPMPFPKKYGSRKVYGILTMAASFLVAVMLVLFPLFNSRTAGVEAEGVVVQEARVEGAPAHALVVSPKESNITIIWVEKADDGH